MSMLKTFARFSYSAANVLFAGCGPGPVILPRLSLFIRASACLAALAACAPVIETNRDTQLVFSPEGGRYDHMTVVISTSRLAASDEAIDPAGMKTAMEEELAGVGIFSDSRVVVTDSSAPHGGGDIELALVRFDFTKKALKLPPAPPLGLAILYPLVAPALFSRDYIGLQVVAEAELLLHDTEGRRVKQLVLFETATGRANFFNSGGDRAAVRLADTALHNMCRQALHEFLLLAR